MRYNKFRLRRAVNSYARDLLETCAADIAAKPDLRVACYRYAAFQTAIDYGRFRPSLARRFADAYVSTYVY